MPVFTKEFIIAPLGHKQDYYQALANASNGHGVRVMLGSFEDYMSLFDESSFGPEGIEFQRQWYENNVKPYGETQFFNNTPEYEQWWYATGGSESVGGGESTDRIDAEEVSENSETSNVEGSSKSTTEQEASTSSPALAIQYGETIRIEKLTIPLTVKDKEIRQAVIGTSQPDLITGSDQGEILAGGLSKDRINGGGGRDTFLFDSPSIFGKTESDIILDFNRKEGDSISVTRNLAGDVERVRLRYSSGRRDTKKASKTKYSFVYDDKSGTIYFNQNGQKAGWGDGGEFARLANAPDMRAEDIAIL